MTVRNDDNHHILKGLKYAFFSMNFFLYVEVSHKNTLSAKDNCCGDFMTSVLLFLNQPIFTGLRLTRISWKKGNIVYFCVPIRVHQHFSPPLTTGGWIVHCLITLNQATMPLAVSLYLRMSAWCNLATSETSATFGST